jgi:hypothetical protein
MVSANAISANLLTLIHVIRSAVSYIPFSEDDRTEPCSHSQPWTCAVLKERGRRNRRSLEAEVRKLLSRVAIGESPESLRELADRIAALTPDVRQTDSTELVRADRGG